MNKGTILIIEDDLEISRLIQLYLEADNYEVFIIDDGQQAIEAIRSIKPNLVLLDLMLPGLSGADICIQAKQFYEGMILVLTASEEEMNEVSLLRFGADDYMTKPVRGHVLLARIDALLRRKSGRLIAHRTLNVTQKETSSTNLTIDAVNKQVFYRGEALGLTTSQFEIFQILIDNRGKIVTRESCCQLFRGIELGFNDRSVDMRISGLRKKLAQVECSGTVIRTIRNKGYMLVEP